MKKVAILFHGHLRSYETTAPLFNKNVVSHLRDNGFDVDVFLHTWDEEEFTTKTWHAGTKDVKKTEDQKIKNCYCPTKFKIEKQVLENTTRYMFTRPYSAIKSVWYSFHQSWKMMVENEKSNDKRYDYVIVTRPDVIHYSNFLIDELVQDEDLWQCQVYCNGAASDVLLYSSRDNIEKSVCKFYENFDYLHHPDNLQNTTWQEYTFNEFVKKLVSVKVSKYCMPRDWRIQRSWWDLDHKEGHRKWDKDLANEEIQNRKEYEYFKL